MKFLRSRRGVVIAAVVLLLALFLIRPGAEHLRTRIVRSISMALGRPVEVASVSLRFLPQPGFDLEDFVVHDDPAFSAEPILRARQVTAALRLSSLLRGRLEIARLSLTEPSFNLVRNREGHWNLEDLLERAAKTPVAPTSKAKSEVRPGFPYIEADRGRINLKFGQEKKPYALTGADFALWQESENAWSMRLKAQPLRTDFNLTDTGLLEVSGSWQRAATPRETPLQFKLQWDRGQLGQVSKLAFGNDKGWRGTIQVSVTLTGTPADLTIQTDAAVQDFRRYDIVGGGALRLAAHCSGHYSSVDVTLSNLACQAPIGGGAITVDGSLAGLPNPRAYDLVLIARDLPIQSLVAFARHAKKNLPEDLVATGKLDANVRLRRAVEADQANVAWQGGGETLGFRLASKLTKTELVLDRIPFAVSAGVAPEPSGKNARHGTDRGMGQSPPAAHVDLGPFSLALGRPAPAMVRAWISRSGYSLVVQGDAQVQRLLQVTRTVGLPATQLSADGMAKIDLQVAGLWSGFMPPTVLGKAQLRSLRAEVRGLNAPLEIASADLLLAQNEVRVNDLTASLAGSTWRGSLVLPRQCAGPGGCPVRFDLRADEIATDELNQLLNPHPHQQPWYGFLSSSPQPGAPYLATLRAVGKLTADRVKIHQLAATRASAKIELENGRLLLSDLRGEVLGGKHRGEWKADFTGKSSAYSGSGTLERVALGQLSDAMHDGWITGTATASYHATATGFTGSELLSSANATLQVEAHDGLLPHIALAGGTGPLHIHRLAARLLLRERKFDIQQGKLETPGGIYKMSGTASLGRVLDLKLVRDGARGFTITGTLTEPRVAPTLTPETQAALKP